MTANELIHKLKVPTNTWDIPVLVEGKEIESVELNGDRIEIKLKKERSSTHPKELLDKSYQSYKTEMMANDKPFMDYTEWVDNVLNKNNKYEGRV